MEKPVLIFDHDGTLHDSMYVFGPAVHSAEQWAREQGYDIKTVDDKVIASCLGLNKIDMWNTFGYDVSSEAEEEMLKKVHEGVGRMLDAGAAKWFDGIEEMLTVLRSEGYHLVILSNCEKKLAEFYWNHFNMKKWFDKFYECETYDFAPKTEIIKIILKDYNEKGIMIGDRRMDLECARSGKVPFIGCSYGFGEKWELDGADAIAESPEQIPEIVRRFSGVNK